MAISKELEQWIEATPKVELHVHMEGSVQPETLLKLAEKHSVSLPADTVEGLRKWYTFSDFNHFIEIYRAISGCLKTAGDIELIAREFLMGQARQHILYSEVTFTPFNQLFNNGLDMEEQMRAVLRARDWAEKELGVGMGIIVDIPRVIPEQDGLRIADLVIRWHEAGVIALGLGGPEVGHPPEDYQSAYDRVNAAGIPCILHAGETVGPESIWSAIRCANTRRIGHGVRAVEDPELVAYLRKTQLPLEVCPTSNLCLKVYPSIAEHSLPKLVAEGCYVTINSDDPPMFNTCLTDEYRLVCREFGWDQQMLQKVILNAVNASLLAEGKKADLRKRITSAWM
jgi:adenosine deaminase